MKQILLIALLFVTAQSFGQIVSIQDSSGYLFSVNPLTGTKTQLTIPQAGNSGKALSTDGNRFSWVTTSGTGTVSNLTATNNTGQTWTITNATSTPNLSLALTSSAVGLGNVTNESKATMFTNSALTGVTTANNVNYGMQSIATATSTTTLTSSSPYYTVFTGITTQTIVLPDATTLSIGHRFYVDNNSTGAITVQTNGGATIATLAPTTDILLVLLNNGSTAGTWDNNYYATLNATGKSATINNTLTFSGTDGTTMTFPTTTATMARTDAAQTFTGAQTATVIHPAGSTSVAPETFTVSGSSLLTTAAAGAVETNSHGDLYYTDTASNRGKVDVRQWIRLSAAYTLTSQTAAQKMFNSTTNGALNVKGQTTYEFECVFSLSSMSATSGSFGFALGGTATLTNQTWISQAIKTTTATTAGTMQSTFNTAANTTIVTASTSTNGYAIIKGVFTVNAQGTIIPQVSLGVAAAAIVGLNSYFWCKPMGDNTITNIGNWN